MKRCPTCNKTFTDRNLSFCIEDGTPLVEIDSPDEVTRVSPSHREGESGAGSGSSFPPYQPPGTYLPPGGSTSQTKKKAWPWVLGILGVLLLLLVGLGIAAAIFVPKMIREAVNVNGSTANSNTNRSNRNTNSNWNSSNSNVADNGNDNSKVESEQAPTDEALVLSQLTDLEHEWTAANINADKKKLDRILADDYAGSDADGKTQGKAEYLRTIERDTRIQNWDFEDLKVDLKGDRATLRGVVKLQIADQPFAYNFIDKFVWRDGRWQAVGSEVTPVK